MEVCQNTIWAPRRASPRSRPPIPANRETTRYRLPWQQTWKMKLFWFLWNQLENEQQHKRVKWTNLPWTPCKSSSQTFAAIHGKAFSGLPRTLRKTGFDHPCGMPGPLVWFCFPLWMDLSKPCNHKRWTMQPFTKLWSDILSRCSLSILNGLLVIGPMVDLCSKVLQQG